MAPRLLLLSFALLVVGCGSDADDSTAEAPADTTTETSTEAPTGDQLFDSEFAQVCRGSAGQPAAAAYVEGAGLHPFLVMKSDDGTDFSGSVVGTFPDGWKVSWPDLADAQLVVCAVRVSATPAQLCEGYEDDDSSSKWSVQTHDVVYEYTVRNAQKGDVLGTQTFEVPTERCPMFSSYRQGDPTPVPYYPLPSEGEIEVFMRPFVTGS